MPKHLELCAGMIQLGGKKSPISVALSIEAIERFLWQFQGRDAVELIRVPGPEFAPGQPGRSLRESSRGRVLAVTGVIVSVLGGLAVAWGLQNSRASEQPAPLAPAPVEHTTHINTTMGPSSPIISDTKGPVNLTINSAAEEPSK